MFGKKRLQLLEEALKACREKHAESLSRGREAKARAQTLERELRGVLGALEEARARVRKLEAALAGAQPEKVLDRVAEALAKRAKPSFAEDEAGPLASFKVGGELVVLRPEVGESHRMFKTRVWRTWLERVLG